MSLRFFGYSQKRGHHENMMIPRHSSDKYFFTNESKTAFFSCSYSEILDYYEDENVSVICDGVLYYHEHVDKTKKASEIFGLLYSRNSDFVSLLKQIDGDFAIVLYDKKRKLFWMARDRIGLRPLYYSINNEGFAFASYPHWLLRFPGVTKAPNDKVIGLFAGSHYRTIDNDRSASVFRDVKQVPASCAVLFEGNQIQTFSYWALDFEKELKLSETEFKENYRNLFLKSVEKRIKTVKKPAFTLSGGLDSSSVLSGAVHILGEKQQAFSSCYSDKTYDESAEIQTMLDSNVSKWHAIQVEPKNIVLIIQNMIEQHGEPIATATWLSHHLIVQEIKKYGFDSVFGGLGGDELNAGEYEYFFYFFAGLKASGQEQLLEKEIEMWVKHHDHPIFKKNKMVASLGWTKLAELRQLGKCLPDYHRIRKYSAAINSDFFDVDAFEPYMPGDFNSYLKNRTFQDIFYETAPCCLRAEDRQSYAAGLRNVLPFYDHELVEFMFQVPDTLKIRHGVTKHLLRQAMNGILPDETRLRIKKSGWNAPAHIWFSEQCLGTLRDIIGSKKFRERGIYNVKEVERLLNEHIEIVKQNLMVDNHMMFFWQLINLELWFQFVETIPSPKIAEAAIY